MPYCLSSVCVETGRGRQQAIELPLHDAIALAAPCFDSGAIQHGNVATAAVDEPRLLQSAERFRHAFPPHAEHEGHSFMGRPQLAGGGPVEGQQQPAAQLLLHYVEAVTDGRLRRQREERLRVEEQQVLQRAPPARTPP